MDTWGTVIDWDSAIGNARPHATPKTSVGAEAAVAGLSLFWIGGSLVELGE